MYYPVFIAPTFVFVLFRATKTCYLIYTSNNKHSTLSLIQEDIEAKVIDSLSRTSDILSAGLIEVWS